MNINSTHNWTDVVGGRQRFYVGGALAASVVILDGDWFWFVYSCHGDSEVVAQGTVFTPGSLGKELAVAMCDLALGHVPDKLYRVRRQKDIRFVRARTGREARRFGPPGPGYLTVESVMACEARMLYANGRKL